MVTSVTLTDIRLPSLQPIATFLIRAHARTAMQKHSAVTASGGVFFLEREQYDTKTLYWLVADTLNKMVAGNAGVWPRGIVLCPIETFLRDTNYVKLRRSIYGVTCASSCVLDQVNFWCQNVFLVICSSTFVVTDYM